MKVDIKDDFALKVCKDIYAKQLIELVKMIDNLERMNKEAQDMLASITEYEQRR